MLSLLLLAAASQPFRAIDLLPAGRDAPGCALEVQQNGQVIDGAATGLANLEDRVPIRAETVFEAGSVSKQFIGAGVAILADQKRLSLDDPITTWLPELPALYRDVTISMLLHHTSGIRSWNNLAELTGRGEDSTGYDNAWVLRAVAGQQRLNNVPGAEYLYSNSNFVLAAIIIERASGQSLNAFFRESLFSKLGMTRSSWRTDFRIVVPNRAQAYLPNDGGGWQLDVPLNGVAGAGGLMTTVGDLQRWARVLGSPGPEDRRWVDLLLQPGQLSDGTQLRYGLGIEIGPIKSVPAFSHAGSTGSYRAWFGLFPTEHLAIALLCNSGAVNTEDLGPEIAGRFLQRPAATRAVRQHSVTAPAELAGLYRNTANDTAVAATIDDKGLHFNNGAGFASVGVDRLATDDRQRTVVVRRSADGKVAGLTLSRLGNSAVLLVPTAPWTPSKSELLPFAGRYSSQEVDGVQSIELSQDALIWRDPSGTINRLKPLYQDSFEAPDASWTLRFRRGGGQIIGLEMSITRARRITFRRLLTK